MIHLYLNVAEVNIREHIESLEVVGLGLHPAVLSHASLRDLVY